MTKTELTEGEFTAFPSHGYKCVVVVWQCQIFTISHTMEAEREQEQNGGRVNHLSPTMQLPTFVNIVTSFPQL